MTNVYASVRTGSWAGDNLQPIEPFPVFLAQEEQSREQKMRGQIEINESHINTLWDCYHEKNTAS